MHEKHNMKKISLKTGRLLLVYLIAAAIFLSALGGVHAATAAISLSQTSGSPGTVIWVNGTGFAASSTVTIYWDSLSASSEIGSTTTDTNGDFSVQVTIPSSDAGTHTIYAQDSSGNLASASFIVVPEITLTPSSGIVGTYTTVDGEGFSSNTRVYVYWDTTYLGRAWTGSDGSFSYSFYVPAAPYGIHTVTAIDSNSNSASASFLVLSSITVSPSTGAYQTQVNVDCTGYSANARISIIWDYGTSSSEYLINGTTDSTGSYEGTFTVPATPYGTHTVTGVDEYAHSSTTSFKVYPKIILTPSSGFVGTRVWVEGYGFSANSAVNITWNTGAVLNTTSTDSYGTFGGLIVIPNATAGNQQITATDTNSVSTSAIFSVTPHVVIDPNTGIAGSTSTVTSTGFAASSTINIYWDYGLPTQTLLSTGTTDSTGTYVATVTIPSGTNGTHTIAAIDTSNNIAQTEYYLGPHITLTPNSGFVGSEVFVDGTTFGANSTVTITWDGTTVATATTDANGTFSTSFIAPYSPYGYHTVTATDSGGNATSAQFEILAHISLSKTTGSVQDKITINGTGFSALAAAYIYWDGVNTNISMLTDANGNFTLTFYIPAATAGPHSIYAADTNTVQSDTQTFIIFPKIQVYPTAGHVGDMYTVYCTGFAGTSPLTLLWDYNATVYHTTSDSTGSGVITAYVPNVNAGVHQVMVYDSQLDMSYPVEFTVLPPDAPVAEAPSGFANTTSPTLTWEPSQNIEIESTYYQETYNLEYSTNADFTNATVITNISGTSYTLSGLEDGVTYYWRVQAIDPAGNVGNFSNVEEFTVDVSPPTSMAYITNEYSNSDHILVYYNASDSISGVAKVELYYSYNGGDYILYASSNKANGVFDFYAPHGDGYYTFYTVAYDNAGNVQPVSGAQTYVIVDTTPPVSEMVPLPKYTATRSIELNFNAQDNGTGVKYVLIYWSNDGTTWNYLGEFNSSVTFTTSHDGTYYFRTQAVDMAGNVQAGYGEASTIVDTVPPSVDIVLNGSVGDDGWYITPVTVGFTASDATSGVAGIYYSINGGAMMTYTAPFVLSKDGTYNITYYAEDFAGNMAPVAGAVIKIDRTVPSLAIASPEPNAILTGNYTVTVVSSDDNIAGVYFRVDNGPWYSMSAKGTIWTINVDTAQYADGEHTFTVKSVDVAGNTHIKTVTVKFDNSAPDVKELSMPSGIVAGEVHIAISASDSVGIKEAKCVISTTKANETMYMAKNAQGEYYLNINTSKLADGHYTVTVYVENYGGKVTEMTSTITVDNTAPTISYIGGKVLKGTSALEFKVSDATTGVKEAWISIDNGAWIPVKVENGMVKYCWNTELAGNGVHTITVKVEDNAGNVNTYTEKVNVNNLNYIPIIYTIVVAVLVIALIMMFRKKKKEEPEPKEEKKEEMSLPDSENKEEKDEFAELEIGGENND